MSFFPFEPVRAEKAREGDREYGDKLAQGYGALKETTFRIGNMGWLPEGYIVEMLGALGEVV